MGEKGGADYAAQKPNKTTSEPTAETNSNNEQANPNPK
jgi:hypothetical protein